MRAFFAILFGIAAVSAQAVYWDHDAGVKPPRVLQKAAPEYTQQARVARLEGSVTLTVLVDRDATIRDVHVTRGLGLGLDERAIEAVRQWIFAPGTKDGEPVPVLTHVDVSFRLLTARADWYLNRADFDTPKGATDPEVLATQFPAPVEPGGYTTAIISFDIDPSGNVVNARAESASGAEQEAMNALRGWKFRPAAKDGQPITVRARFGFAAGQAPQVISAA